MRDDRAYLQVKHPDFVLGKKGLFLLIGSIGARHWAVEDCVELEATDRVVITR